MTIRRPRFCLALPVALATALPLFALAPALAQQPRPGGSSPSAPANSDPAAEIAALQERIKELEKQLLDAQKRIMDLTSQLENARRQAARPGGAGGSSAPSKPQAPASTPAPSVPAGPPNSSPDALLHALVQDYEQTFGAAPRATPADQHKLKSAVSNWTRQAARQYQGRINWVVRFTGWKAEEGVTGLPIPVTFEVVDPATGKAISKAANTLIPYQHMRIVSDDQKQQFWRLTGNLIPKLTFNEKRTDKAAGTAPFIGPYAEFAFDISVTDVTPANIKPAP